MVAAGTLPCDTSQDALTSGRLRPSQFARTRSRGALITSGSDSRRRAADCGAAFSTVLRRVEPVHAVSRGMPPCDAGGLRGSGIAHGLIGSRFRIRLPGPSRLSQRRPAPVKAYDASLVENTMNRPLTSTSGLVLSTSPEHWVSLL